MKWMGTEWRFKSFEKLRKKFLLAEAQNYRCAYCHIEMTIEGNNDGTSVSVDHVVPRCRGGKCRWSNEVAACRDCNTARGDIDAFEFYQMVQDGLEVRRTVKKINSSSRGKTVMRIAFEAAGFEIDA